mmetsp:Transcript_23088/g.48832  ORF Transcript_23088/g.48832 Transcript_23088/m.48832 type:complete len:142 (-) Transcript_23088:46-471(-)|eukprot:CAMPEP_0168182172 /NCGR_PEP_ID=MMETSP0139_2-20121125/11711_1 /TAXON_ID=44445 /ORGANISM="Pseudo-nitzschia australis, Strain 10249 10 AB" /LENGTH=141 /DNA_ID=CAMNT_0008103003 /DNA_START=57 /DNA_END=482 /DNA_ORIENTATION=+
MSNVDNDAEWTVHKSQRTRRPTPATVTPARDPNRTPYRTGVDRKPKPKSTSEDSNRTPNPTSAVAAVVDTEQVAPVPSTRSNRPDEDGDKSSVDSMSDNDRYTTMTVKDFVPAAKLVPITNNIVTSNDLDAFRQAVLVLKY